MTVIIPVFNEAATLKRVVEAVRAQTLTVEIIGVDDASGDGTGELLDSLHAAGLVDIVLHQPKNLGKGAAVRLAIPRARGQATVVQDADLEYDPAELHRLFHLIALGKADAVFGSRLASGGEQRMLYFWHYFGNKTITFLTNILTGLSLTDAQTCYKMVRTALLKSLPLQSNRFGIDPEIVARLSRSKARIVEIPISYKGRTHAQGKKITWRDGIAALWHILHYNLSWRR